MPLRTSPWWWFLKNDRGVLVAQPGAVGDERVAQRVVALGEAPPEPLAKLVESRARPLAPHRPRGRRARGQRGSPPGRSGRCRNSEVARLDAAARRVLEPRVGPGPEEGRTRFPSPPLSLRTTITSAAKSAARSRLRPPLSKTDQLRARRTSWPRLVLASGWTEAYSHSSGRPSAGTRAKPVHRVQ